MRFDSAKSCPEELSPVLNHASVQGQFSPTNKQIWTAPDTINQASLYVGCFVLRVDRSLSEGVARFEMKMEVVFI